MRRSLARLAAAHPRQDAPPIISIANGTFYRHHPSTNIPAKQTSAIDGVEAVDPNPPLFDGLNFSLPAFSSPAENWSILGKSSAARTAFLQVLRGQYIAIPPSARSFPYLASDEIAKKDLKLRSAQNAIKYVGFDAERGQAGGSGMKGLYLSARYESRKEETDFSLMEFLTGNTELNADLALAKHPDQVLVDRIIADLKLGPLIDMPVTHLSNGQTRRAKIAKALLSQPEVLLLDGPFMGLDPPTLQHLSKILQNLAEAQAPRLILSLKPDELIPDWITHLAFVTQNFKLESAGPRKDVIQFIHQRWEDFQNQKVSSKMGPRMITEEQLEITEVSRHIWDNGHPIDSNVWESRKDQNAHLRETRNRAAIERSLDKSPSKRAPNNSYMTRDGFSYQTKTPLVGKPVIEMEGVKVQYGDKAVLGNWKQDVDGSEKEGLWWTVCQGQRWGIFGPNGSGKTTLISLITSDHPQTYSLPIKLFGRSRLPEPGKPGISIFDLQKRIGHSSPEVHVFFPKNLSLRRTIESAWADTPLTRPKITTEIDEKVSSALLWFRQELVPSLGPPRWMDAEIKRFVAYVDAAGLDHLKEPKTDEVEEDRAVGSRILRQASEAIIQDQKDMEINDWADNIKFGDLTFSAQRVALFIRAVIRNPDLVVLDEAFSGMDDAARDKCMLFLSWGEEVLYHVRNEQTLRAPRARESDLSRLGMVRNKGLQDRQALVVISHKKEEVPGCVRDWICLPESGEGLPRFGHLNVPLEAGHSGWREIWGDVVGGLMKSSPQERELRELKRAAIKSDPRFPRSETRKEREERIARFHDRINALSDDRLLTKRGRRGRTAQPDLTKRELKARMSLLYRIECSLDTPEERERRVLKRRLSVKARYAFMTPERREEVRERARQVWQDRLVTEDTEKRKERQRTAARKHNAKLSLEQIEERRRKARQVRNAKLAKETPEERAERSRRRKEYLKGLAPDVKTAYRKTAAQIQRNYRERQNQAVVKAAATASKAAKSTTAR